MKKLVLLILGLLWAACSWAQATDTTRPCLPKEVAQAAGVPTTGTVLNYSSSPSGWRAWYYCEDEFKFSIGRRAYGQWPLGVKFDRAVVDTALGAPTAFWSVVDTWFSTDQCGASTTPGWEALCAEVQQDVRAIWPVVLWKVKPLAGYPDRPLRKVSFSASGAPSLASGSYAVRVPAHQYCSCTRELSIPTGRDRWCSVVGLPIDYYAVCYRSVALPQPDEPDTDATE